MNRKTVVALTLLSFNLSYAHAQSVDELFTGSSLDLQLRAFWFDGRRDLKINRTSLTVGGIVGVQSGAYEGFSAKTALYSSNALSSLNHMSDSAATQNLQANGDNINTLGEGYLQYSAYNSSIRLGRQRLDFPLINDYYNRMLPNSFEALNIENHTLDTLIFKAAYVTKWKYKTDNTFESPTDISGIKRDIAIIGALYTPNSDLKLEFYDTYIQDVMHAPYLQFNNKNIWNFSNGSVFSGGIQYLNEKSIGQNAAGKANTYLLGLKGALSNEEWSLSALYTRIGSQALLGTGSHYEMMGWSSFLTYTDLQIDGESENAGAIAYATILSYAPNPSFTISTKYAYIHQDDSLQSNPLSLTNNPRPDSNEYNIDAIYKIEKNFQLRTRLAYLDYLKESTSLYKNRAFDETNVRLIIDYSLNFSK